MYKTLTINTLAGVQADLLPPEEGQTFLHIQNGEHEGKFAFFRDYGSPERQEWVHINEAYPIGKVLYLETFARPNGLRKARTWKTVAGAARAFLAELEKVSVLEKTHISPK